MAIIFNHIDSLGRFFTKNIEYTARVLLMVYLSLRATILDQAQGFRQIVGVISAQIYFTGWQALPLITVMALGTGSILILGSFESHIAGWNTDDWRFFNRHDFA